jgi:hypothetical protein
MLLAVVLTALRRRSLVVAWQSPRPMNDVTMRVPGSVEEEIESVKEKVEAVICRNKSTMDSALYRLCKFFKEKDVDKKHFLTVPEFLDVLGDGVLGAALPLHSHVCEHLYRLHDSGPHHIATPSAAVAGDSLLCHVRACCCGSEALGIPLNPRERQIIAHECADVNGAVDILSVSRFFSVRGISELACPVLTVDSVMVGQGRSAGIVTAVPHSYFRVQKEYVTAEDAMDKLRRTGLSYLQTTVR